MSKFSCKSEWSKKGLFAWHSRKMREFWQVWNPFCNCRSLELWRRKVSKTLRQNHKSENILTESGKPLAYTWLWFTPLWSPLRAIYNVTKVVTFILCPGWHSVCIFRLLFLRVACKFLCLNKIQNGDSRNSEFVNAQTGCYVPTYTFKSGSLCTAIHKGNSYRVFKIVRLI